MEIQVGGQGYYILTFLAAQVPSHPPQHSTRIWDYGGREPSERSSTSNAPCAEGLLRVQQLLCAQAARHPSSAGGHPDKARQECNGQRPSAWKDLKNAKGHSKPKVIHISTSLRSAGGGQGGRVTSTLTSFPCTSKHPSSPIF